MRTNWSRRNGWDVGHLLAAVAMVAASVGVTWSAWADILHFAIHDQEMSHIFLVPLVVAWLVWVRRQRLRLCLPRGTIVGPILVASGWLLYSLGDRYLILSAWHLGAIVAVLGALLSVLGWQVLWRFAPAVFALLFLIPVPGTIRLQVSIPLQTAAASATQSLLDLFGMAVVRTKNLLIVNDVKINVVEACNGLRMVFGLTLVSYLFAFGTALRNPIRLLIVLASPLLALGSNIIRLGVAVWVFGHFPRSTAQTFHDYSGWAMLPLGLLILLGIIRLLRWALVPVTPYTLALD